MAETPCTIFHSPFGKFDIQFRLYFCPLFYFRSYVRFVFSWSSSSIRYLFDTIYFPLNLSFPTSNAYGSQPESNLFNLAAFHVLYYTASLPLPMWTKHSSYVTLKCVNPFWILFVSTENKEPDKKKGHTNMLLICSNDAHIYLTGIRALRVEFDWK